MGPYPGERPRCEGMEVQAIWLADWLLAGGWWMGWILRLVETGIDSPPRVIDVIRAAW
jgi:hypothetical protein